MAASSGSRQHRQGEEGKRTQHETVDRDDPIPEPVGPHPAAHKQVEADIMSPAGGHGPRVSKGLAQRSQRDRRAGGKNIQASWRSERAEDKHAVDHGQRDENPGDGDPQAVS